MKMPADTQGIGRQHMTASGTGSDRTGGDTPPRGNDQQNLWIVKRPPGELGTNPDGPYSSGTYSPTFIASMTTCVVMRTTWGTSAISRAASAS